MKTTELIYLIETAEQGSDPQDIDAGKEARKELEALLAALAAQPSVQSDGSKREPTIIKSFPMQNAYPAGHKPKRRR